MKLNSQSYFKGYNDAINNISLGIKRLAEKTENKATIEMVFSAIEKIKIMVKEEAEKNKVYLDDKE